MWCIFRWHVHTYLQPHPFKGHEAKDPHTGALTAVRSVTLTQGVAMVNLTNKTSVTWEALQPLLTTHPFVGTFVVPTPGSAPAEVLQARALRSGKMFYFTDGSTRLTEAEVIATNSTPSLLFSARKTPTPKTKQQIRKAAQLKVAARAAAKKAAARPKKRDPPAPFKPPPTQKAKRTRRILTQQRGCCFATCALAGHSCASLCSYRTHTHLNIDMKPYVLVCARAVARVLACARARARARVC